MTRIIAGAFRGRRLTLPADSRVRPTSDKVREAWLAIVGPELSGARVLDLYAGSGALGLEAVSRGASEVVFVDVLAASLTAIRKNVEILEVQDRVQIIRSDGLRYVEKLEGLAFGVAFADPPYRHEAPIRLVERFRRDPFARVFGIEHPSTEIVPGDETRRYGDTAITFCYAL